MPWPGWWGQGRPPTLIKTGQACAGTVTSGTLWSLRCPFPSCLSRELLTARQLGAHVSQQAHTFIESVLCDRLEDHGKAEPSPWERFLVALGRW